MGVKGSKKNKEKSQKQSSDQYNQKESSQLEKQRKDASMLELPADKASKKSKLVKAINENMKTVEKSNK